MLALRLAGEACGTVEHSRPSRAEARRMMLRRSHRWRVGYPRARHGQATVAVWAGAENRASGARHPLAEAPKRRSLDVHQGVFSPAEAVPGLLFSASIRAAARNQNARELSAPGAQIHQSQKAFAL